MDLQTIFILIGTGVVGGVMAAIVGGASVITFPVLLAVGLPPVVATASNLIAVSAGNFLAAFLDRAMLPPFNRAFAGLVIASLAGAMLGAVLLLATPTRMFEQLIPVLLAIATVLFAYAGRITQWMRARAQARGKGEWKMGVTSIPLVLPISVYGGYFGAGAGTLLLGALTIATEGNYRRANAAKNLVSSLNTVAASVWFVIHGAVSWPHTFAMMAGCLIGGFCGVHLSRRVPQELMRWVVIAVGFLLTAVFAWRYWF
ncbi:MAG: sulfite exporter TauE/SafE family protein [Xanthobacteraceae bacterium]|nr:sulfite exporter TauE/SafE family protein [Xanthobacteraceae bacterium]